VRFGPWLVWPLVAFVGTVIGRGEAACQPAACINLVFDGDSISAGWGASPGHGLDARVAAELGGGVRLHNVAEGGRPVSKCLELYAKLVAPLFDASAPHNLIVFHAGDNDVLQGRGAAQTYLAFAAYVAAAHEQGWKVVVSTELRRSDFHSAQSSTLEDYNDRVRQNSAGADAVVDFDADARMTDMSYRLDPALFTQDGIHPSDSGYAVLANMLTPVVKRVAGR
jgi:lysophospholipase L1-like esterase